MICLYIKSRQMLWNGNLRVYFYLFHGGAERNSELFSLQRMVWNGIPRVCFYFCSTERNSKLIALLGNGSERNSKSLLLFLFHCTEFPEFFSSMECFGTEAVKSPALCTSRRGEDRGLSEGPMMPSFSNCSNSTPSSGSLLASRRREVKIWRWKVQMSWYDGRDSDGLTTCRQTPAEGCSCSSGRGGQQQQRQRGAAAAAAEGCSCGRGVQLQQRKRGAAAAAAEGCSYSSCPSNGFANIKIMKSKTPHKNRYIGIFMSIRFCILWDLLNS